MFNTTERTKPWPGYSVTMAGSYNRDPVPDYIAKKYAQTYSQPGYSRQYSKIRSDNVWVKGKWKDCQHYTEELLDFPKTTGFLWVTRNATDIGHYAGGVAPWELAYSGLAFSSYGPLDSPYSGLPSLLQDEELGDGFVPAPTNLHSELIPASLRAMLPRVKAELSLVNSIIELKDFRSLPRSILKLRDFCANLTAVSTSKRTKIAKNFQGIRQTFPSNRPTLSEALGVGSDSYLQAKFNILPLLSDITGISNAIVNTRRRVNDLLVRQGKRQVKHFKVLVPSLQASVTSGEALYTLQGGQFAGFVDTTPLIGPYKSPSCSFKCVREFIPDANAVFHAQVEYNFWFTRFQTENAQLLGFLDALGVNLNPAIIWNAIPWTFAIDWLVDINEWLSGKTILNLQPAVNISRYMWSWKYSDTVRLRLAANSELNPTFTSYCYLPDNRRTIYRRQLDMPDQSQFLTGSGLSSNELSLGVALAIPLGRRRKTRK
jgi:hypothetical protein